MAEIATNVLHDVGNVLNSVNVSASLVIETVARDQAEALRRVSCAPPVTGRDAVYVGRKCPVDAEESDHLFRRKVTGHFGGK